MDLLFANTPESILIFDSAGRLVRCTDAFLHMIELESFGEIEGMEFTRLYRLFGSETFVRESAGRFERIKLGKKTLTTNVRLSFPAQRSEREGRLYTIYAAPMLDEAGSLDGVIVQFHDSTEQARAEADERTRAMLDATPLGASLWSEAIEALDCNEATLNMFGLTSVEEFRQDILKLMPSTQPGGESSGEAFFGLIRQAFQSGYEEREWLAQRYCGEPIPCDLTFVRVEWGGQYGVVCFARDLRALRASQAAMREADERTHVMLDAMPLACSFWDENLNVIDCNQGCVVLFGLSSKEEYLRRFHELSPEFQPDGSNSRETALKYNRRVYETGERQRFEWVHWNPDTKRRFLTEVTQVRVRWKDDYRVINYVHDMSEIEESEARRHEAEAHSRELEVQTRAAKVASEAKSSFLATMSHEIRTPMNAIIGMIELLRIDNLDEHQKDFIVDIRKMSQALLHIINGILDFSKIEAGKLELTPVHFNLPELYDNICSISRFMAESKDLRFSCGFAPDVPQVLYGDDVRLRQVITNLLNNAIKYTRQGGVDFRVTRVRKEGEDFLAFTVADTGIGIRRENFEKLFHAFEQFDSAANRDQVGTGLGLAITRSLVAMMHGHIELKSEYGKGSTFTIVLPLTPGDPREIKAAAPKIQPFVANTARVLVVDDNQINLKVALAYLERYGVTADKASSGREALEKVRQTDYDLVFMDQMMPEMDGLETTRRIRALEGERYRKLPIVALSANAVRGANRIFLEAGMNDFISKPIDTHELSRVLVKWLPPEKLLQRAIPANEEAPRAASSSAPAAPAVATQAIQQERGLANAANDVALYWQLRRDFQQDHRDDLARLWQALDAGDITSAHRIAHTLKSNAALLGAQNLSRSAAAMEDDLRAGQPTWEAAKLATLAVDFQAVLDELAGDHPLPEARAPEAPDAPEILDKARALALLDKLEPLLERGNAASLNLLADIRQLLSPLGERCGLLVRQMEDFDFACARQTLFSLRDSLQNNSPLNPEKE
jgi:signal transduction histidine kinase/DNA-binding NarL/FixJ family response regulator